MIILILDGSINAVDGVVIRDWVDLEMS
jgi:hypothetical protein